MTDEGKRALVSDRLTAGQSWERACRLRTGRRREPYWGLALSAHAVLLELEHRIAAIDADDAAHLDEDSDEDCERCNAYLDQRIDIHDAAYEAWYWSLRLLSVALATTPSDWRALDGWGGDAWDLPAPWIIDDAIECGQEGGEPGTGSWERVFGQAMPRRVKRLLHKLDEIGIPLAAWEP